MEALLVVFLLLAVGFGAGYGTREMISRKRKAEYRKYSRRPPSDAVSKPQGTNPRARAERGRTTPDITGTLQQVYIQEHQPVRAADLHSGNASAKQPNARPSGPTASFEESLEESLKELQNLLQGGPHQN